MASKPITFTEAKETLVAMANNMEQSRINESASCPVDAVVESDTDDRRSVDALGVESARQVLAQLRARAIAAKDEADSCANRACARNFEYSMRAYLAASSAYGNVVQWLDELGECQAETQSEARTSTTGPTQRYPSTGGERKLTTM